MCGSIYYQLPFTYLYSVTPQGVMVVQEIHKICTLFAQSSTRATPLQLRNSLWTGEVIYDIYGFLMNNNCVVLYMCWVSYRERGGAWNFPHSPPPPPQEKVPISTNSLSDPLLKRCIYQILAAYTRCCPANINMKH